MIIKIGSECMGIWGKFIVEYFIRKVIKNIDVNIIYENSDDCDIIIRSVFYNNEEHWNTKPKKYIYWSGEFYTPASSEYETSHIYMLTTTMEPYEYLHIPYFLFSSHINKDRLKSNIDRKYLLGYCSSRSIPHREEIYNAFVENSPTDSCHALGASYGNYIDTKIEKVEGEWFDFKLIEVYSNYKFVLAVENTKEQGYITEKIVNAFYSGAIPIYWGCSTINNYFNKNAFINVDDFSSYEECVKYVNNLDEATIQKMSSEPIYNPESELVNLLNDEYNSTHTNKTYELYLSKFKEFLLN
jgi:hypothetical protein